MTSTGYSIFTESKATEHDMEIQNKIEKALEELIEDLEDNYGITIDLQFSWDYYEPSEEEKQQ